MSEHVAVWTTTDSAERAEELARSGVTARLAACAQIDGPIRRVSGWEGSAQTDEEWRVVFKTPASRYPALEALLLEIHTYDTLEVVVTDVPRGSRAYLQWMDDETRGGKP